MKRNRAYSRVPAALVAALWNKVSGERALEKGENGFLDTVASDDAFVDFVEAWWPPVDAVDLWRTLPQRIGELANGAFSADELAALKASWDGIARGEPHIEDVPLIDELRYLVGEVPPADDDDDDLPRQIMSFERRERDDRDDRVRSTRSIEDDGYAHVLVDEAQDLSPMQWRMLARRGRYASWTIVGDAAQSSWPHPDESAAARTEALEGKDAHEFRLSTNYRNSAEIYDLAAQVAPSPSTTPTSPTRSVAPGSIRQHLVVDASVLAAEVVAAPRPCWPVSTGTVAVVAARADLDATADAVAALLEQHPGGFGCSRESRRRAWSSTASSSSSPTRSPTSPARAGARCTSSSPARPSASRTVATTDRWRSTIA